MERINLDDVQARLNEIIDRAEAGESIEITRHGRLAARIVPPECEKKPIDVTALRVAASKLPYQHETGAEVVRRMRDSGH